MISFWVDAASSFGFPRFLARRAPHLVDRIQVRTYESLTADLEVTRGAHIFASLDQLSETGRSAVTSLYQQLSERCPGDRLLNDPAHTALRYRLLTTMFDAGINTFRVRRPSEDTGASRFPVFVREESGHTGALTGLLANPRELAAALRSLRARGYRTGDLLVVEFCDLSDATGLTRSASAFKVGDRIIPAFQLSGRHWMLKWNDSDHDERAMREFVEYVTTNPHEAWLRRIFDMAGVGYGRIDYGIQGEKLQVWEINLNPTPGPGPGPEPAPRPPKLEALQREGRAVYVRAMEEALRALDPEFDSGRVALRLDPGVLARVGAERKRSGRHRAILRLLQRLYHRPWLGRFFRALYARLLPRR